MFYILETENPNINQRSVIQKISSCSHQVSRIQCFSHILHGTSHFRSSLATPLFTTHWPPPWCTATPASSQGPWRLRLTAWMTTPAWTASPRCPLTWRISSSPGWWRSPRASLWHQTWAQGAQLYNLQNYSINGYRFGQRHLDLTLLSVN